MKRISKWLAVFGVAVVLAGSTSAFARGSYGFSFGFNSGYRSSYCYPRSYSYGYAYFPAPYYYYAPPVISYRYDYCQPRYYYSGGRYCGY